MNLKSKIRTIPNYPKPGIMFRDITTLLKDNEAFGEMINDLTNHYWFRRHEIDKVVGIESRGFIIGSALAYALGKGFIPARKKGKLPAKIVSYAYELEYGTDQVEIHCDAIQPGERILLVDDLLATGGTSRATARLIERLDGKVVELAFVIDLPDVGGRERLEAGGYKVYSLIEFKGE